jgi:broad specificity phosphatase PhoE
MPANRLHFVRHGEVFNPKGVLYERIPGFQLSDLGHQMAEAAAKQLASENREIVKLLASPLQRTQESAAPVSKEFGLEI